MGILLPVDVYRLVDQTYRKNKGEPVPYPAGIVATFVALKESGGNTSVISEPNDDGSVDVGLWQWNSKAWPQITRAMALDPVVSTQLVYEVTEGFNATKWGPWMGDNDTIGELIDWSSNNQNRFKQAIQAAIQIGAFPNATDARINDIFEQFGTALHEDDGSDGISLPGVVTPVSAAVDLLGNPLETLTEWTEGLKQFFSVILNPTFWKRIGIGVLGVGVLITALVWYNKDDIAAVAMRGKGKA